MTTPPPTDSITVTVTATCLSADPGDAPKYIFRWRTAGGRKKRWRLNVVRHDQVPMIQEIIAFAAARDTEPPRPKASKKKS